MLSDALQYPFAGHDAASIAQSIEHGVLRGHLLPGDVLPSVRRLATMRSVSPTTVAAAYRELRQRGVIVSHDRSHTTIAHRPPLAVRLVADIPPGTHDLATGNPDPELLPDLGPALRSVGPTHRRYGAHPVVDEFAACAAAALTNDGIAVDDLAVVGGALDGIERVLEVHGRVGDRVAVEDPGYIGAHDLVRALGFEPVPIGLDDEGPRVDDVADALAHGVSALLFVPRAQNPTGASWSATRADELRALLDAYPEPLVIEDDALALLVDQPYFTLTTGRQRWAVIRSVAKALGPDLRVAALVGDADTVTRVQGRQRLGTGWVSHLLQRLAAAAWTASSVDGVLAHARATYHERRHALLDALAEADLQAHGASGLNVWIPVHEEVPIVQGLASRGWAVQAGEPFRISSDPAIRVTTATLTTADAPRFAADLHEVVSDAISTRRG